METLAIAVALATLAIPALTEAATASQTWHLPASKWMAAARCAALAGLVGMIVALTGAIVGESANAASGARHSRLYALRRVIHTFRGGRRTI